MAGKSGEIKWSNKPDVDFSKPLSPKYSLFGEHIRHVTPSYLQCSMFCGGKQCKYDNPLKFKENEMAIFGLYSSWVTKNILATSRPSTEVIKKHNIIEQFQNAGIKSIINLQQAGEHSACGFGLEPSGFSYEPKDFMDNNVFFYNFCWNDYGVRSLSSILDMVKVMDFALQNGKVAVHCHAGLGRTGVLIACYLIYSLRCSANEAIHKMRLSRPKAIQTRGQINCVQNFAQYLKPMWIVFSTGENYFTLERYIKRQNNILHGEIRRSFKYMPQIIYSILERLLQLAEVNFDLSKTIIIKRFNIMQNSFCNANNKPNNFNQFINPLNNCIIQSTDSINHQLNIQFTDSISYPSINEFTDFFSNTSDKLNEQMSSSTIKELFSGKLKKNSNFFKKHISSEDIVQHIAHVLCEDFKTKAKSFPEILLHDNYINLSEKLNVFEKQNIFDKNFNKLKNNIKEKLIPEDISTVTNLDLTSMQNVFLLNTTNESALQHEKGGVLQHESTSHHDSTSHHENTSHHESTSHHELILKSLAFHCCDIKVLTQIERHKRNFNCDKNACQNLKEEINFSVLSGLFWSWLYQLKGPIISCDLIEIISQNNQYTDYNQFTDIISSCLKKEVWKLCECFLTFLSQLNGGKVFIDRILRRFAVALTKDDSFVKDGALMKDDEQENWVGSECYKFLLIWLEMLQNVT
ncbi:protein tyrosine phosphatase domain-containing protein 1 isoform X1 [Hydra vulgaris]|uniref:protein tyrosine phosphatase domain-containing protein 1 isoform X1 n=1 Tax=Hydra vulgaris TaxID=6087 RepID=UPI001F5F8F62|nr:protein tyrosine phosphatase domain-containing protein 1 [Hydra vulgaris]